MSGDIEKTTTSVLTWDNLAYELKGKPVLSGVSGEVYSGELLAVMGPSGAGKSTFLDVLAGRTKGASGSIALDGQASPDMSALAAYVEQHDALLGVLTVRETLLFAARLALPPSAARAFLAARTDATIAALGLARAAHQRIGTPLQRGVSGGQRRRVALGAALVRRPRILLLDEPTSGLDAAAAAEVVRALRAVARAHGTIVVASVHQPNYGTLALFDRLLLLTHGRPAYFGATSGLAPYMAGVLHDPVPEHVNPADHALALLNDDFAPSAGADTPDDKAAPAARPDALVAAWAAFAPAHAGGAPPARGEPLPPPAPVAPAETGARGGWRDTRAWRPAHQTGVLAQRMLVNYARNVLAYGVRAAMYVGMGILLATVWVRLAPTSATIDDRLSVHFFSVAFLGFMSVAGIPAFLEERHVFARERADGLYGPLPYVLAQSACVAPFLFACSALFAVICYWSIGLHAGAGHFFRWLGILFLAVYTAEAQSLVVAALVPIFVAALAIAAFLNGFWMCVQGYFIRAVNLPAFWRVWAHWIDYQTYAFAALVAGDLRGLVFACATRPDGSCQCAYPSSLVAQGECALRGEDVLQALGIDGISIPLYAGILLCIALVYRVLFYLVLVWRK